MSTHDAIWRLGPALLVLVLLLVAEWRWPWRTAQARRWPSNFALGVLSAGLLALLPALSMSAAATWASARQIGVLHALPAWLAGAIAVLLLDLAVYIQHRTLHVVPLLWRLHRVHHLDPMLDVSSGLRFHPLEALVSALYKALVVILLGAPVMAAVSYAVLLNLASLFNHANIRLPALLERNLRRVLITPALHRIHHSDADNELMKNYGTLLTLWDHLFGSWRATSVAGDDDLRLGVPNHAAQSGLARMLGDPLHAATPSKQVT